MLENASQSIACGFVTVLFAALKQPITGVKVKTHRAIQLKLSSK